MPRPVPGHRRRATLRAYRDLPHPWAVLLVLLATALFGLLATGGRPAPPRFALLLAAMLGGQIAIGALNEYIDRDLDAAAGRPKPIPAGLISPRAALGVTAGGLALMLAAGALLGLVPLLLVALGTGAGLVYDLRLKRTAWSWLPYLVALPLLPVWVWVTLARFDARLLLLYPLGALMVLAVHLAQSLPDAASDRRAGAGTLVARLGRRRALAGCLAAAALGAAGVAVAALLLTPQPGPAVLAAAGVLLALTGVGLAHPRVPQTVERHLFPLVGAGAIALAVGWLVALGV
ncbi:MAG: UbiA family prenyltransferase [Sphaerobacter sp.]|nr:UbiA family prenyltransferase [Sphaerobacter sp.]